MFNVLSSGGILVIPLIICLILAVGIVLERCFVLNRRSMMPAERMTYLCDVIGDDDALSKLKQTYDGNPLHQMLIVAVQHEKDGWEQMRQAMTREQDLIAHELERFLNALGSIAVISPLLGLLGTVLGMIEVFESVLDQGVGVAPSIAGGISQALVTTALGMAIAIPSVLFSRFFQRRVDSLLIALESRAIAIFEQYRRH